MGLKLKTAPALTPVSLDEAKLHCKVEVTDDDTLIEMLIDAAVSRCDGYAGIQGRCLISQVWELYLDAFPAGELQIPLGPVITVDEVRYTDAAGASQTFASSNFTVDTTSLDSRIVLKSDASWPATLDVVNAVKITFTAGYGTTADSVPAAIREAMLLMTGDWYRNRENTLIGPASSELPLAAAALLAPFRRTGF